MSLFYCITCCCCLFLSLNLQGVEGGNAEPCKTLRVLHMLPESVSSELSEWQGQLESIQAAGELAAQHINSNSDLLTDFQVEVLTIPAGNCSRDVPATTIVDILQVATDPAHTCIFAVAGLSCHGMTDKVAAFLSHSNFGYVQLSSSISPVFRNTSLYPHLHRVVGSTVSMNTAVIAAMDRLNWTKINIDYDLFPLSVSTASDFLRQVKAHPDLEVRASVNTHEVLPAVSQTRSRVIYLAGSVEARLKFLCDAALRNYLWPNFVYILTEVSMSDLLTYKSIPKCSVNSLKKVLEGQIILRNRLSSATQGQSLVSGVTYQEYAKQLQDKMSANGSLWYSNALYDQIMAFALAMNNSLDSVRTSINDSFSNIIHATPDNRNVLSKALNNVSFLGASGWIEFNQYQETSSIVDIFHIINGKETLVGRFDSTSKNLTGLDGNSFPPDAFDSVPYLLPVAVGGVILAVCAILLIVLISSGCVMVCWREESEVKATGLSLSILILVGCMIECLSVIVFTLLQMIVLQSLMYSVLCNLQYWLFVIGLGLIMVTLMFRLLRIYVFFHFPTVNSKRWKNMYLLLYVTLTMSLLVFVLFLWAVVEPLEPIIETMFVLTANPPYVRVDSYCIDSSGSVWLGVCFSLIAVAILILLMLAILTRHVPYKDFKDTKKVSIFIFSASFIFCTCVPLILVLNNLLVTYILNALLSLGIVIFCLLLIIAPKIFPVMIKKVSQHQPIWI